MLKFTGIIAATFCLSLPAGANPLPNAQVVPASFSKNEGTVERLESGDYLRTYSQELAAAACFYHNGIEKSLSHALLVEAHDGFRMHLDALRNGNEDLGIIGGEERRKTLVKLDDVEQVWGEIDQAIVTLLKDHSDKTAVGVIKDKNLRLYEMTSNLLNELQGEYTNPMELLQVDMLMLEIAGRQSLMTQKIAKNACKLLSGRDTQKIREDLGAAVSIYELSLDALLNGMPQVGLKPAPTEEIADGLRAVQKDWAKTRPIIDAILDGTQNTKALNELFKHMAKEMHKLEDITHKYVIYSKRAG